MMPLYVYEQPASQHGPSNRFCVSIGEDDNLWVSWLGQSLKIPREAFDALGRIMRERCQLFNGEAPPASSPQDAPVKADTPKLGNGREVWNCGNRWLLDAWVMQIVQREPRAYHVLAELTEMAEEAGPSTCYELLRRAQMTADLDDDLPF